MCADPVGERWVSFGFPPSAAASELGAVEAALRGSPFPSLNEANRREAVEKDSRGWWWRRCFTLPASTAAGMKGGGTLGNPGTKPVPETEDLEGLVGL